MNAELGSRGDDRMKEQLRAEEESDEAGRRRLRTVLPALRRPRVEEPCPRSGCRDVDKVELPEDQEFL